MEYKSDEARVDLRRLHNSKTPFYSLFIIIIIFMISLLYLPFRFQSFGFKFTNFLDTNDRHCIFLLCNCILFLLVLDSVTNQIQPQEKMIEFDNISVASVHDHSDSLNLYAQNDHVLATEVKQSGILVGVNYNHDHEVNQHEVVANVVVLEEEHDHSDSLILYGDNDHELAMEVKEIEQSGILVGVDDHHDDHLDVDDEHEITANFIVEEQEHDDQEEAKEFRKKCEEFIKKMKQSMHHEGRPYPVIDYQESAD